MNYFDILQVGTSRLLKRQEEESPAPYLQEHPERRPHIVHHSHQHFLRSSAPDIICMGGLIVYENGELMPETVNRTMFVPRFFHLPWFGGLLVPPPEFSRVDVAGIYKPIDLVKCEHSVPFAMAVMDRWFGYRLLNEDRMPSGDVLGVFSERALRPPLQDPLID